MIESRQDFEAYLAADLAAHELDRWRLIPCFLTRRPLYFQRLLRRWEYYANVRRDPLGRLLAGWYRLRCKLLGERLGYQIPKNVFGPGLSIAHTGTVAVNELAVVGRNCRIHHVVSIASANGRAPRIGDDVFIAPHVVLLGDITIGDGVGIRAGAVVVADVPSGVNVAGVPARVIG